MLPPDRSLPTEGFSTLRRIIWANQADTGLEHFRLQRSDDEILADGIVIGVEENVAFRIRYQITCDLRWQVRKVVVTSLEENGQSISLMSDGFGNWTSESADPILEFEGCFDVDITATPFTNTLPIRRLDLPLNDRRELQVLYINVFDNTVKPVTQWYTRLSENKYLYEGVLKDFKAEITVDEDGLVTEYPGLFSRVSR